MSWRCQAELWETEIVHGQALNSEYPSESTRNLPSSLHSDCLVWGLFFPPDIIQAEEKSQQRTDKQYYLSLF